MAFYQMNFVLPTRKTFLTFFGVFVLLSLGLFQLFPVIFGGIVSLLLGTSDSLLVFFAHHEAVYGFFQDMIRTLYCCCVLGAFNFFFYSPPGSSVHEILKARIVEWVAMPSSRDLPDLGIKPASLIYPTLSGGFLTTNATVLVI